MTERKHYIDWVRVLACTCFLSITCWRKLHFLKHLNFSNRFLRHTNLAVFPFYLLHQTIIVAAGYFIVQWQIPIAVKLLLLAIACFASTWLIYQWIIRPFALPRILFGLAPKERLLDDHSLQESRLAGQLTIKRTVL